MKRITRQKVKMNRVACTFFKMRSRLLGLRENPKHDMIGGLDAVFLPVPD
jgi:hypothetical protein